MEGRHVRVRYPELKPSKGFILTVLIQLLMIGILSGVGLAVLLYFLLVH